MSSIIHRNQSKPQTYARYLDAVRSSSLWHHSPPITPKGIISSTDSLIWPELIRKFQKHNPNRSLAAQAATLDHAIHTAFSLPNPTDNWQHSVFVIPEQERDPIIKLVDKLYSSIICDAAGLGCPRATTDQNSAKIVVGFGYYVTGNHQKSIEILKKCSQQIDSGTQSEKYDYALLVLSRTVLALAYEQSGADLATIINIYNELSTTYTWCISTLSIGVTNEGYEEMHTWAEIGLYRYALLTRKSLPDTVSLEAHRLYHSNARYWPSPSMSTDRCGLYKSYLVLLIELASTGRWTARANVSTTNLNSSNATLAVSDLSLPPTPSLLSSSSSGWRGEVSTVERAYEKVLGQSVQFPRSGDTNVAVLEFCKLVVEAWKVGGCVAEQSARTIDVLYRATQQTFHSQRIFRYLVQVLSASEAWEEACEALELYVKLFTKAKEIQPDSCELETGDHDTDEEFLDTVILGVRVLIKYRNEPVIAAELVDHALAFLEEKKLAGTPVSKLVEARVQRFAGIAAGVQAQLADRETRPALHASYLQHLNRAASLDSTSFETFYHLSYAQAEQRDIDSALSSARKAVELNANSKHAWHLLALLTTASKEQRLALDIIEVGLTTNGSEEGSEEEEEEGTERRGLSTPTKLEGRSLPSLHEGEAPENPKHSTPGESASSERRSPVESSWDALSTPRRDGAFLEVPGSRSERRSGSTSQTSAAPPLMSAARAEAGIAVDQVEEMEALVQLRMTKNVVLEAVDGPEVAMSDQQALFAYFATLSARLKTCQVIPKASPYAISGGPAPSSLRQIGSDSGRASTRSKSRIIRQKIIGRKLDAENGGLTSESPAKLSSRTKSLSRRKVSNPLGASVRLAGSVTAAEEDEREDQHPLEGSFASSTRSSLSDKLLQSLWLMSAATFRRWGKMDECRGAIQEAEAIDPEMAEVWVQYALYNLAMSNLDKAVESLEKALSFDENHIGAIIHMARILKEQGSIESAQGLLEEITNCQAWDIPEAWFLLSQVYGLSCRFERVRDCLLYALGLEQTRCIRSIGLAVPRCL